MICCPECGLPLDECDCDDAWDRCPNTTAGNCHCECWEDGFTCCWCDAQGEPVGDDDSDDGEGDGNA